MKKDSTFLRERARRAIIRMDDTLDSAVPVCIFEGEHVHRHVAARTAAHRRLDACIHIDAENELPDTVKTHRVTGTVFEIERFAVNDGPGIRTLVFMKGCGLRCRWCSNPESQASAPQLGYSVTTCIGCGRCVEVCEEGAVSRGKDRVHVDTSLCTLCGRCVEECPSRAMTILGREMTPEEILAEVLKDEPFYRRSGGGVTFSGGEPFEQPRLLSETAKLCRDHYIHVAVETCGAVEWGSIENALPHIDLVLYDIKETDPNRHRKFTGGDNVRVLENYRRIAASGKEMVARIPVIPGYNDRDEHFENVVGFLEETSPGIRVDLLPYHRLGRAKYERLGKPYLLEETEPPSEARMEELMALFQKGGFEVTIGG